MKQIIILTGLIIVMAACGTSSSENPVLTDLISKRDSLKANLSIVNEQIAAADTTKKEVILLVTTESVRKEKFSHKVEIQGEVETDQNVMLNAEANGVIKKVNVKEGQKVSKGQALVIIDSEIISTSIAELKTGLELANFMYNKQVELSKKGLGTEIELEQAKNQKNSLNSKLRSLEAQKGKTVVRAPFSGIVDQIFTHTGEMASPASPLIRLVNNTDMRITASVSENYLGTIEVGTPVGISFPNYKNYSINSNISYIGNYIDEVNRTFRVQVKLKNTGEKLLLPNQLVKLNITDFKLDSALVVSKNAILQDTENNNYVYVLTASDGDFYSVKKVYIHILSSYKGQAAIEAKEKNSIEENSRIVLAGGKGITEKDKVKLQ
ncbi:hypothetical protein DNU06_05000 [Putridiphycobacter roseus]|uniref:Uncharacterized protein n=1 Tax=Putridiphycobacter roseus TaxID=2219161 RepID=A0A2W1N0C0_9FLAO|nr:efflux RND transporter periplasmic adaptor subunit [Putridiphycobacter roseus]PZE17979.1 hypothetical protein DNU06_05000 [Putridiphycobacter roseus]